MPQQIKRLPTPANENQLVGSIIRAWKQVFGSSPTLSQAGKVFAQIAMETGNGKYIFNNNVGNITWTPGYNSDYYTAQDSMSIGGDPSKRKQYIAKFRSYDSLDEGVLNYISFLKSRPAVLSAMDRGNSPKDFSYALAKVHYYDPYIRDDYTDKDGKKVPGYTTGLTSRYNDFVAKYKAGKIHAGQSQQTTPPQISGDEKPGFLADLGKKIEMFLNSFASNDKNVYYISIKSESDLASKLEYARILKLAAKEELDAKCEILTDNNDVQVKCILAAPKNTGNDAIKELCVAVADAFAYATQKIGNIQINTDVCGDVNKIHQKLNIKQAEINYRKFHLKFVNKEGKI